MRGVPLCLDACVATENGSTDPSWVSWHWQWTAWTRIRPEGTGRCGAEGLLETGPQGRTPPPPPQEGRHPGPLVTVPVSVWKS